MSNTTALTSGSRTNAVLHALQVGVELLGSALACAVASHYAVTFWQRLRLPPGPLPRPLYGNFKDLAPLPHRGLQKLHQKYGPLLSMWLGNQLVIVLGSPEIVKQTHKDKQEGFQHRVLTDFAKISLHADEEGGKNVALAGGAYWKKARRIFVQELMSQRFINTVSIPAMVEEVHSAMDAIRELSGAAFDPHDYLQRLSLNIVFRLTYSCRFDREEMTCPGSRFMQLKGIIENVVRLGAADVKANYIPVLKLFNRNLRQQQAATVATRDSILRELLDDHRRTLDRKQPRDFLDVLLLRQEAEQLSDTEVQLIAWEFITAGTDTTSATMHWMILLLANHPRVQAKAWEEIDRVTGGQPVTVEDQSRLPYTNAVWKEAMRWMPVVPMMVAYRASDNVPVSSGGREYIIKQGTQVWVNGFNMHRDPSLWKDPDSFFPERFLEGPDSDLELRGADAKADVHHLKFLPMGTGRRACAGYNLARVELFLQAASLLQCFEWKPPHGRETIKVGEVFGIAVSPKPFEVVARFRSEAVKLTDGSLR